MYNIYIYIHTYIHLYVLYLYTHIYIGIEYGRIWNNDGMHGYFLYSQLGHMVLLHNRWTPDLGLFDMSH